MLDREGYARFSQLFMVPTDSLKKTLRLSDQPPMVAGAIRLMFDRVGSRTVMEFFWNDGEVAYQDGRNVTRQIRAKGTQDVVILITQNRESQIAGMGLRLQYVGDDYSTVEFEVLDPFSTKRTTMISFGLTYYFKPQH